MQSTGWHPWIAQVWDATEPRFDALKEALAVRLTGRDRVKVDCYHGYGDCRAVTLWGRVLEDPGKLSSNVDDRWWENIVATVKRFETDELSDAEIQVQCATVKQSCRTDAEGYFRVELDTTACSSDENTWMAKLINARGYPADYFPRVPPGKAEVTIVSDAARYGIITDVDDTVLPSHATQWWKMVYKVLMENATTRLPFPGVAEFYAALAGGDAVRNPIFYVSSSPWNIYDLIVEIFSLHGLPAGPLLLKDLGIGPGSAGVGNHIGKLESIRVIMKRFPTLPFILIGDSGQHDPWIYQNVVHEFPGRVMAVYIRDILAERVDDVNAIGNDLSSRGVPLLLMQNTQQAFDHSREHGWT